MGARKTTRKTQRNNVPVRRARVTGTKRRLLENGEDRNNATLRTNQPPRRENQNQNARRHSVLRVIRALPRRNVGEPKRETAGKRAPIKTKNWEGVQNQPTTACARRKKRRGKETGGEEGCKRNSKMSIRRQRPQQTQVYRRYIVMSEEKRMLLTCP